MLDNDARGLESPERQAESTDNYAVCPACGAPILALTTSGPSEHFFEPCGCRASMAATRELAGIDEPRAIADGGISFTDLHAFERDLLYAIRALEGDEPPKGLALKEYLEADYSEEINHSRLYQNLDALIDHGLVTKGEKDARTNEYATTDEGRRLVERHAEHRAEQVGLAVEDDEPRAMTDGGLAKSRGLYPVSVRVEVADGEVTWHTSETAYERLHNHPSGNLVAEIEADVTDCDGSLYDVVVASSGAYWVMEVDAE